MTKEQSAIIDALIEEFNKISRMPREKKSFNLIDIGPIQEKIMIKQQWEDKRKKMNAEFDERANQEALRIAELLRLDLPGLTIYKFAKENGYTDSPTIRIESERRDWECVHVRVDRVNLTDPYGDIWQMPSRFVYEVCDTRYETIEEAMTNRYFIENVRKLLMNKK